MNRDIHPLILASTELLAPRIIHLRFEFKHKEPLFQFIPGQFITLLLNRENRIENRNYSIANSPEKPYLEIALGYVPGGFASEYLFHMKPGDSLNMQGPYGRLILKPTDAPKRFILVGTGTGVTPYRSMFLNLSERLNANPNLKVELILGVREPKELLYGNEFLQFKEENPRFNFHVCYSRIMPSSPRPFEHSGYVQTVLNELNLNPNDDLIYLCGHPKMIDDTMEILKNLNFSLQQIRREKYVFSHGSSKGGLS